MRITPAHVLTALAVGIPMAFIVLARSVFESPEGEEPWGELLFVILATLITITSVSTFGTIALVIAKPESEGWKTARRVGLGIIGLVSVLLGCSFLAGALLDEATATLLGPVGALVLLGGVLAFFVLIRDMMQSRPSGGWRKVVGFIGLALAALYGIPFILDLGTTTLLVVCALLAALGVAYVLLGGDASATEDTLEN